MLKLGRFTSNYFLANRNCFFILRRSGKFNKDLGIRDHDGIPLSILTFPKKVIVATVSGRDYYRIVTMLKSFGLNFISMLPEEASLSDAKVIITTESEAHIIKKESVIVYSEISTYPIVFKARILKNMIGKFHDDILIIGVDPGHRIGIYILYLHDELERTVQSSTRDAIKLITILLKEIHAKEKIVRIGDGHTSIAHCIASEIKTRFRNNVRVEIVDEFGTSRKSSSNRRGIRDESSAKSIAMKKGYTL